VVEEVGSDVRSLRSGDFVIAPFMYCDNSCPHCRVGIQSACSVGGFWGGPDRDGLMADVGQREYVRVPLADGTLLGNTPPQGWLPGRGRHPDGPAAQLAEHACAGSNEPVTMTAGARR
jgi:Alcohol dehydrogenase GroES-like domain